MHKLAKNIEFAYNTYVNLNSHIVWTHAGLPQIPVLVYFPYSALFSWSFSLS
jgi:hypothetical protein